MPGMNRHTGATMDGIEHLSQSVTDILTTPQVSRIMRRTYGSQLPELLDHPDNATTRVRLYAAVASALMSWEPRLRLSRVRVSSGTSAGQVTLDLSGEYRPTNGSGRQIALSLALQFKAAL